MQENETKKIIAAMITAYPNYRPENIKMTVELWTEMLVDYGYEQIATALKAYITSNTTGFAPAIGQLIAMVQKVSGEPELNEMEAWALVSRALRNGYYGAEEEFEKLPPMVQKAVGNPGNLRNWSQTETGSVENVIQSNFLRTYRAVVARNSEIQRMPQEVRKLIDSVHAGDRKLECFGEERGEIPEDVCVPMPKGLAEKLKNELFGGKEGEKQCR